MPALVIRRACETGICEMPHDRTPHMPPLPARMQQQKVGLRRMAFADQQGIATIKPVLDYFITLSHQGKIGSSTLTCQGMNDTLPE